MTVCSLAALSKHLKMSWLRGREGGAEGKLHLATLHYSHYSALPVPETRNTQWINQPFLSACMLYHLDDLGGWTNWSLRSNIASSLAKCSPHFSSSSPSSSDLGLLLDFDFLLLGFGESSLLLASRGFRLLVCLLSVHPSQHTDL